MHRARGAYLPFASPVLRALNRATFDSLTCPPQKIPVRGVSETARPKGFVTCGTQMAPCTIAANKGSIYGTSEGVLLRSPSPLRTARGGT